MDYIRWCPQNLTLVALIAPPFKAESHRRATFLGTRLRRAGFQLPARVILSCRAEPSAKGRPLGCIWLGRLKVFVNGQALEKESSAPSAGAPQIKPFKVWCRKWPDQNHKSYTCHRNLILRALVGFIQLCLKPRVSRFASMPRRSALSAALRRRSCFPRSLSGKI